MKPLHWTVPVSCAVLATASMSLMIVSDVTDSRDFGRWGLSAGLLAIMVGAMVIADRFARRICQATGEQAEQVIEAFHDQTEDIAEAVCTAVLDSVQTGPFKRN